MGSDAHRPITTRAGGGTYETDDGWCCTVRPITTRAGGGAYEYNDGFCFFLCVTKPCARVAAAVTVRARHAARARANARANVDFDAPCRARVRVLECEPCSVDARGCSGDSASRKAHAVMVMMMSSSSSSVVSVSASTRAAQSQRHTVPRAKPQRHARRSPELEVEKKHAITEVVRRARGVETRGSKGKGGGGGSRGAGATSSSGASAYSANSEIAPAMPLVEVLEPETNRRLLCMLRRRFTLANGEERCLVLPVDTPIDVLRGEGLSEDEDLSDIDDVELRQILPDMNKSLALRGFLLQRSAFCMTIRGPVRMNEDDTLEMDTGGDEPNEGVEVCTFASGASRYLVYAPLNPVLLITKEDPESKLHEVMFDEEMSDEALDANMQAAYAELSEPEDDLFGDDA